MRRAALWRLGAAATAFGMARGARQLPLPIELPDAPRLAPLGAWEAMVADYATTGLTVHDHPVALLRDGLAERGAVTSADLERLPHEAPVRIGGLVVARQRPGTAKGIVFLLLEDELGTVNLVVPPAVYERDRLAVRTEPLVVAEGRLERFASARRRRERPRAAHRGARRTGARRAGRRGRPRAAGGRRGGRGARTTRGTSAPSRRRS